MTTELVERSGVGDGPRLLRRGHGRRRRTLLGIAAVLVLALLAAGIAVLSTKPRLASGSFFSATATSKVANDGYANTRFVVDGSSGGVLQVSMRNPSRIPVTILGLATTPETPSSLRQVSFEADPFARGNGIGTAQPLVSTVTLGRGDEAGVLLQVKFPDCMPSSKGLSLIYDAIPLRVRRLGVTRTVMLPLDLPLWVHATTGHAVTASCSR